MTVDQSSSDSEDTASDEGVPAEATTCKRTACIPVIAGFYFTFTTVIVGFAKLLERGACPKGG